MTYVAGRLEVKFFKLHVVNLYLNVLLTDRKKWSNQ